MYTTPKGKRYNFSFIDADILGEVYQQYISTVQSGEDKNSARKKQGIYYTPRYIVDYIVENTLEPLLDEVTSRKELENIKILDPAVGSGSFLIKAFEVLDEVYETADVTESKRRGAILQKNLFGVDLDPQAAEIAQLNLLLVSAKKRELLPMLDENIKVGNSLISGGGKKLKSYFGKDWAQKRPFNWVEKFEGILSEGGFDVVVGNPPWVESKKFKGEDNKFYRDNYSVATGQYDLFTLFVEKSLSLLKDGGLLGFIIPDRFMTNLDYAQFRKFLLDNFAIKEIIAVGEGVFKGVQMPSAILILEKEPNKSKKEKSLIAVSQSLEGEKQEISQKEFLENEGYIFSIFGDSDLRSKIVEESIPFGKLVDNARGVEIGKKNALISDEKCTGCVNFLVGEDIDRYSIKGRHFLKLGAPNVDYKDPSLYKGDKILVRKTGSGIRAVVDKDSYVIQVIYIFKKKSEAIYALHYLLALLNSKLMNYYYWATFGEKGRKTFPHLTQGKVLQLPIKKIDFSARDKKKVHDQIAKLSEDILKLNNSIQKVAENSNEWQRIRSDMEMTDKQTDQLVYKLYNLTLKEIKIVEGSLE